MRTHTPVPPRDPRADKVRRLRALYLAGRIDEVLFDRNARWDRLADAVFAGQAWGETDETEDVA